MIKILLAALVLLAPVASAGVSQYAEVAPEPTEGCESDGQSSSNWTFESYPGYRHIEGWYARYGTYDCERRADVVAAGVASNEHDVAEARVGSFGDDSGAESHFTRLDATTYGDENSSSSWYEIYESEGASRAHASGTEAVVSVANTSIRAVDGCQWSSVDYSSRTESGYVSRWNGSSSGYEDHNENAWGESTESCGQTATLASGVTTLSAGKERSCSTSQSSYSYGWTNTYPEQSGGRETEHSSSRSSCTDGAYASAGSERVDVGDRTTCSGYRTDSQGWGWSNGTYSYASSDCRGGDGVYGPQGLALYLAQEDSTFEHCENGECTTDSTSHQGIGVGHDYVGAYVIYLS